MASFENGVRTHHGYAETEVAASVEPAGIVCSSLHNDLTRLRGTVEEAAAAERSWVPRFAAGLRAGLDFLTAEAIRPSRGNARHAAMPEETARLLADRLLVYLLTPSFPDPAHAADEQLA